ncbi:uncharacterized protein LOC136755261 isoform X2 [Amia ocellicauda]|uniref:uncharacterized protein LOC136755261 isoform X2 n=1 Tax=Amia ocellicauda TaxID=2972642 RepID=UPI0034640A70
MSCPERKDVREALQDEAERVFASVEEELGISIDVLRSSITVLLLNHESARRQNPSQTQMVTLLEEIDALLSKHAQNLKRTSRTWRSHMDSFILGELACAPSEMSVDSVQEEADESVEEEKEEEAYESVEEEEADEGVKEEEEEEAYESVEEEEAYESVEEEEVYESVEEEEAYESVEEEEAYESVEEEEAYESVEEEEVYESVEEEEAYESVEEEEAYESVEEEEAYESVEEEEADKGVEEEEEEEVDEMERDTPVEEEKELKDSPETQRNMSSGLQKMRETLTRLRTLWCDRGQQEEAQKQREKKEAEQEGQMGQTEKKKKKKKGISAWVWKWISKDAWQEFHIQKEEESRADTSVLGRDLFLQLSSEPNSDL